MAELLVCKLVPDARSTRINRGKQSYSVIAPAHQGGAVTLGLPVIYSVSMCQLSPCMDQAGSIMESVNQAVGPPPAMRGWVGRQRGRGLKHIPAAGAERDVGSQ